MARKRAAGGGRKPRGPFFELTSSFTVRMPNDLRKKLERAAKKRPGGGSVGQELLQRLQQSFAKENEDERDSMLRMFGALMDAMLGAIAPERRHWEKDPWLYRAFYCAVHNMFSRFRPEGAEPGEEKLPESWRIAVAAEKKNRPDENLLALITQSPEEMGAYVEKNMSAMLLDQSLVRNTLNTIQTRSGIEFSADAASRMAARFEDLDFVLSHARRIMKRRTGKGISEQEITW
jgi:Arc-like DNA binding domain